MGMDTGMYQSVALGRVGPFAVGPSRPHEHARRGMKGGGQGVGRRRERGARGASACGRAPIPLPVHAPLQGPDPCGPAVPLRSGAEGAGPGERRSGASSAIGRGGLGDLARAHRAHHSAPDGLGQFLPCIRTRSPVPRCRAAPLPPSRPKATRHACLDSWPAMCQALHPCLGRRPHVAAWKQDPTDTFCRPLAPNALPRGCVTPSNAPAVPARRRP